jgi:PAT family beta-lactamase induction signal transducer AmpG
MNLTSNPRLRILTLCALYLAQGMPFGFVTITLVTFLKHQGAGVEQIGIITAMTSLPWAFKWAWGPVIDRFGSSAMGKRRPWILFAQSMMAATLLAMALLPDLASHYLLIAGMVFLHNVFVSLQDVSTDALAVDLLDEGQRGKANGLMYASSYAGTFIGGSRP